MQIKCHRLIIDINCLPVMAISPNNACFISSLLPRVKFMWRMFPKSVTRLGSNCPGCETCFLLLIGLFKVSGSYRQGNSAGNVWNYSGYVRLDSAGACFGYVDILFDISFSNCSSCGDVSISVFQHNYFL